MSEFSWPTACSPGWSLLAPTCGFPNAGAKYARRARCQHDLGFPSEDVGKDLAGTISGRKKLESGTGFSLATLALMLLNVYGL